MFYAHAKAWKPETRQWDKPVRTEHHTKQEAVNWCAFNREWMVDLWVDGPSELVE